jgi:hypothetical protein
MTRFSAPWSRSLQVLSGLTVGVWVMAVTMLLAQHSPPWLVVAFFAFIIAALLFMVRGYSVIDGRLLIHRPFWNTVIPLRGLVSVEQDRNILKRSYRIFGNGGAFSFTGMYRNDSIGNFRVFANSTTGTLLLRFPKRKIVIATDMPEELTAAIHSQS